MPPCRTLHSHPYIIAQSTICWIVSMPYRGYVLRLELILKRKNYAETGNTTYDDQNMRGPGRELNPGPPPSDVRPKKESYY